MRILHTSDWHIGRTFHGHQTLVALRTVLEALVSQVRENAVDLVLVAGDVFDSATPSADCYTLLTDTLVALRDAGARVVVTSGNHDSAARLGFQSRLLREGIHVLTDPARLAEPVTVADAAGPVHVYGLPFLEPALLRHEWPGVRTQEAAMTRAMELVRADLATRGGRSVVMAHCFAAGVEPTAHLERDIQQGGLDVVPLSVFDGVDYAALGHIHGRARLEERVRYCGAPLHYGFGEGGKPRGSWLVDLDADGRVSASWLDLPVPRRLVTLRASLDDLLTDPRFDADVDAWVQAEYTDTLPQRDVMRRLQQRFPHCALVVHAPAERAASDGRSYAQRVRSARSDRELFDAFLSHVREGEGATAMERELVADLLDERVAAEVRA
ncbi:exonuclease SbcCD subunit D [Microbacterium sp. SORGH_AS_0888]|uniref:exonuclease SbcCD subunit D n=1 Tax=Microbacterium sp. SORGH_AS_0888 TaxID=3041791 RepID=UPI0027D899DD|nr:exonuclease SbcCD subunit D [Microbacterium sp. SORGH_AS_0888]